MKFKPFTTLLLFCIALNCLALLNRFPMTIGHWYLPIRQWEQSLNPGLPAYIEHLLAGIATPALIMLTWLYIPTWFPDRTRNEAMMCTKLACAFYAMTAIKWEIFDKLFAGMHFDAVQFDQLGIDLVAVGIGCWMMSAIIRHRYSFRAAS